MPYKIINASIHHQHALKRRTATRLYMEPLVAGKRLMLRQSVVISDEQYALNKADIDQYAKDGVVTVEPQGFSLLNIGAINKLEFADNPTTTQQTELSYTLTNPTSLEATNDYLNKRYSEDQLPEVKDAGQTGGWNTNVANIPPITQNQQPPQSSPSAGNSPQRRDDKKRTR